MRAITHIVTTMLMLIALYLVLRFGANAGKVIAALSLGAARVFRTLQGQKVRGL